MRNGTSDALGVTGAPLAVSMGDPAGVGPEVILKACALVARQDTCPQLVIVGDFGAMRATAKKLGDVPEPYRWRNGAPLSALHHGLPILEVGELSAAARRPGRPTVEGAEAAYQYIITAANMALAQKACGLVTGPISKDWLNRAGHHFPGHSELLAELCRVKLWRMMFAGEELRLVLVTVHIGLAKVPAALTCEGVFQTIALFEEHLRLRLGIAKPRLIVLGLNPHAGENGLFGDEEARVITPAIERTRRAGLDVRGPVAPDTAFARPNGRFEFDGAVAMYHDQGLLPLKTLEFERAINITLGLPFVRTSPDHGTAFDIAGRNCANPMSMKAAIEYAWRAASISKSRKRQAATRRQSESKFA
jgi:4-hydroxythreonine-4-phosphate dehydrogenase